jgi:hypothetical protein
MVAQARPINPLVLKPCTPYSAAVAIPTSFFISSSTSQTLAMAWRGAASRTVLAAVRRPAPAPAAARLRGPAPFAAPRHRVPPAFATSSPVTAAR